MEQAGLRDEGSSEPPQLGFSCNTSGSVSPATVNNEEFQKTATVAAEARERTAAQQAAGSLPWIGVADVSELQQLRADHATRLQESANFQLGGPEKRTGATTRGMHCRRTVAWQTCGTWMTSCVTRSWCRPSCRNSMSPTPKSGRSGTHRNQVSSATRTTWVQHLLSGGSRTCRT